MTVCSIPRKIIGEPSNSWDSAEIKFFLSSKAPQEPASPSRYQIIRFSLIDPPDEGTFPGPPRPTFYPSNDVPRMSVNMEPRQPHFIHASNLDRSPVVLRANAQKSNTKGCTGYDPMYRWEGKEKVIIAAMM